MSNEAELDQFINSEYTAGFSTDIESDTLPPGLDEDVIRFISAKKEEPEWVLEWRLQAYAKWLEMESPDWSQLNYPPDRKSTRLNSSHVRISYAVFCLKKK